MAKELNPFIVTGKIEPEYFCDRNTESSKLVKSVTNGNNIVLISPRRMGKTGLIRFFYDKPEIRDDYYTFFIDILHTSSLRELTYVLCREIFDQLQPRGRKLVDSFLQTLRSLSGKFGFDISTGSPTFSIELGDIERPEFLLGEIFYYLEQADKPCIVAIDEFQQIAKYPEKNVETLLRGYIQKSANCNFIYAGSERHMMQEMFVSSARPSYHSADMLELKAIAKEIYVGFAMEKFGNAGKCIQKEDVEWVYDLFCGHTFYMQKTLNEAFSDTLQGEECNRKMLCTAIENQVNSYDVVFREVLSNVPEKQKELLYAIALDGNAMAITSAAFIRRHHLSSSSSVQAAARKLIEKELVSENNKVYSVQDKFFGLWMQMQIGPGKPLE